MDVLGLRPYEISAHDDSRDRPREIDSLLYYFGQHNLTHAFLCPNDSENEPMIELTHNWDTSTYERGNAYGHVAYQVASIQQVQERLKKNGYDLSWGPGSTPSGDRRMAFVDDPDGFEIELLEGRK
jgi:lactoylglutathione lyase